MTEELFQDSSFIKNIIKDINGVTKKIKELERPLLRKCYMNHLLEFGKSLYLSLPIKGAIKILPVPL